MNLLFAIISLPMKPSGRGKSYSSRRFQFPGPDSIYASLSVTKNLVKKLGKRTLGYGIQISCSRDGRFLKEPSVRVKEV